MPAHVSAQDLQMQGLRENLARRLRGLRWEAALGRRLLLADVEQLQCLDSLEVQP